MTDTSKPAVIQCLGLAGLTRPGQRDPAGQYLRSYDPDAHGGQGDAQWTPDLAEAHVFGTFDEAFEAWRAVPAGRPARPDGQPNRPLTAYSVTFVPPAPAGFRREPCPYEGHPWPPGNGDPGSAHRHPAGTPPCGQEGTDR